MIDPSRARRLRALAAACLAAALAGCGGGETSFETAVSAPPGEVHVTPAVLQRLGVRTAAAELGPLPLDIAAVGSVSYDATAIRDVYAPTAGWVENLAVHAPGEAVRAGAVLLEIYSPSLATVDEQYLGAVAAGMPPTTNPYSGGLRAIGLTENMIEDLRAKKRAPGRIPFRASADGFVTELEVRDGALVKQGDRLLQAASVDPVWVSLAIPESAAPDVARGASVLITTPVFPGRKFLGSIDLVSPRLDERTRTIAARVVVANADAALKLNMFVSARIGGAATEPMVHVPSTAVIRGAAADRVVVALGDGRFTKRSVVLGRASGDRVAIVEGLHEGEQVVTSGVFLIDAETNLESGLGRLDDVQAPSAAPASHTHQH